MGKGLEAIETQQYALQLQTPVEQHNLKTRFAGLGHRSASEAEEIRAKERHANSGGHKPQVRSLVYLRMICIVQGDGAEDRVLATRRRRQDAAARCRFICLHLRPLLSQYSLVTVVRVGTGWVAHNAWPAEPLSLLPLTDYPLGIDPHITFTFTGIFIAVDIPGTEGIFRVPTALSGGHSLGRGFDPRWQSAHVDRILGSGFWLYLRDLGGPVAERCRSGHVRKCDTPRCDLRYRRRWLDPGVGWGSVGTAPPSVEGSGDFGFQMEGQVGSRSPPEVCGVAEDASGISSISSINMEREPDLGGHGPRRQLGCYYTTFGPSHCANKLFMFCLGDLKGKESVWSRLCIVVGTRCMVVTISLKVCVWDQGAGDAGPGQPWLDGVLGSEASPVRELYGRGYYSNEGTVYLGGHVGRDKCVIHFNLTHHVSHKRRGTILLGAKRLANRPLGFNCLCY